MTYTKTCPVCGKEYVTSSYHMIYCSEECAEEANRRQAKERARRLVLGASPPWKVPKRCAVCGVEFLPGRRDQILCGKLTCRDEMQRRRSRGYAEPPELMQPRACKICGTVFTPKSQNQCTCGSDECQRQWRIKRQTEYNLAHKEERNRRERERQAAKRAAKKPIPESLRDAVRMPDQAKPGRGRRRGPRPGSLEWCVREADKRGMSYGMFVAAMDAGTIDVPADSPASASRRKSKAPRQPENREVMG